MKEVEIILAIIVIIANYFFIKVSIPEIKKKYKKLIETKQKLHNIMKETTISIILAFTLLTSYSQKKDSTDVKDMQLDTRPGTQIPDSLLIVNIREAIEFISRR